MSVRAYPESFKKRVVAAWLKQSGPLKPFAEKMGISPTALYDWINLYKRGKLDISSQSNDFLEVAVQEPVNNTPTSTPTRQTTCSLQVADSLVLFSSLPPPDWFAQLLRGLKPC